MKSEHLFGTTVRKRRSDDVYIHSGFIVGAGGFTVLMFILLSLSEIVDEAPVKYFNKNSEKFKKQVNILLKKSI